MSAYQRKHATAIPANIVIIAPALELNKVIELVNTLIHQIMAKGLEIHMMNPVAIDDNVLAFCGGSLQFVSFLFSAL